jgi:subtilisin family serine protease
MMVSGRQVGLFVSLWVLLALAIFLPGAASAQQEPRTEVRPTFQPRSVEGKTVPNQVIVKYEKGTSSAEQAAVLREESLRKRNDLNLIGADVAKVQGRSVKEAIEDLEDNPDVEYAERDRAVRLRDFEAEPRFDELWGLHNTGQEISGKLGVEDVDIDALEASDLPPGSEEVVVAVIDDGVDFTHPDLAGRAWENDGEVAGNNIDDDGNGYIDDVYGYDIANDDNTVHDVLEDGHGTHVAGTIAASMNGQGVVGVAPSDKVRIMAVKFIGGPFDPLSDAIEAIEYASDNGATISNNSWG